MSKIGKEINQKQKDNKILFKKIISKYNSLSDEISLGGGKIYIGKQHAKGRLTARERIDSLIDKDGVFFELGKFAAYNMYEDYGKVPAGGVVSGLGKIHGQECMIIANDATVKAGAYFEITLKKTLRCQEIALENNIPIIYLVDSAGVFLPLQDQVFPDENHFGRIFYNNAIISSKGIPQIACVMGPCVAGGAYLPVMCDKYIIVDGASMFLAGPALVKAAVGQDIDEETLGGSNTHTAISGTADYKEEDDYSALNRIRKIISNINFPKNIIFTNNRKFKEPEFSSEDLLGLVNPNLTDQYDMKQIIARLVDASDFDEYKKNYGKTLICGHARIGGYSIGIIANQKHVIKSEEGQVQLGGVVYNDSADKAARFVMNCNQDRVPIIFIHDVNGFMVGKHSEWSGIAKDGAKLVNAVSNCKVPKISLVIGGSYGAGNYAMSGRAYSPRFLFAWPSAKVAVMGGEQAAKVLYKIKISKLGNLSDEEKEKVYKKIKNNYEKQSDVFYGAARMWFDEVINPIDTRYVLIRALDSVSNQEYIDKANYGVFQV
ncbi:MAG: methylcrotonoyl-CoA carboxylase [Candidatus Marinimicrobia bacterium]|nr:methylcrotonoyl-CoA carboxylase [Candidatus Neomarinimicrobiota bacterium]|tara:strand:- start:20088 stop:21725 length:1638 start_codon:yes stop_codon:yes gene_type:complete